MASHKELSSPHHPEPQLVRTLEVDVAATSAKVHLKVGDPFAQRSDAFVFPYMPRRQFNPFRNLHTATARMEETKDFLGNLDRLFNELAYHEGNGFLSEDGVPMVPAGKCVVMTNSDLPRHSTVIAPVMTGVHAELGEASVEQAVRAALEIAHDRNHTTVTIPLPELHEGMVNFVNGSGSGIRSFFEKFPDSSIQDISFVTTSMPQGQAELTQGS